MGILKHIRHYDHYGFIDVTSHVMLKVAKDLEEFEKMVVGRKPMKEFRTNCQMASEYLENDLARALRYQRTELIAATSEISRWIRDLRDGSRAFCNLGI